MRKFVLFVSIDLCSDLAGCLTGFSLLQILVFRGEHGLLSLAAMGVIRIADANVINALKLVSVRRDYDPRDFILIAFGGAMHAGTLMRELRAKKIVFPTASAVFSAFSFS